MDKASPPQYTCELVGFLHALRPEDLSAEVLARVRYFLLDYLAVAIRGSREESARAVQRMIERAVPGTTASDSATVLGTQIRTLPGFAALANGTASHSIECDDTHSGGALPPGTPPSFFSPRVGGRKADISSPCFFSARRAGYE